MNETCPSPNALDGQHCGCWTAGDQCCMCREKPKSEELLNALRNKHLPTPPVVEEMPEEWGPDIMHDLINSFDTAHDDYKPQARRHLERFIEYWAKKPAELQNEVEWLKSALQSSQQRAEGYRAELETAIRTGRVQISLDKIRGEMEAMKPVVEAALEWAAVSLDDRFAHVGASIDLDKAIEVYRSTQRTET